MWRRPAVTILMLIMSMILAPSLRAKQRIVSPAGPCPDAAGRPAHADVAPDLSPARGDVAPTFRSACGDVALTFRSACAELKFSATTPGASPAKPFTQEQVSKMVQAGLGDESGAELIEQRGIDFAPSEDFYQSLEAAGGSEAFPNALRAAVAPGLSPAGNVAPTFRSAHADVAASLPRHGGVLIGSGQVPPPVRYADLKVSATSAAPASAKKPLNQVQVFALLVGQVSSHRVPILLQERGIDFDLE